jgi:hypothetical protein
MLGAQGRLPPKAVFTLTASSRVSRSTEILHKRIRMRDQRAVARLRVLTAFRRRSDEELAALATEIRRHDCLTVIAAELGFPNWTQAKRVLTGGGEIMDFGTVLCPPALGGGHINRWYARYEEAATARETCQGYLLGYRRQYVVVDRYYIEDLGLDPVDADWQALGFDWVRPRSVAARVRLYAKLIAGLPKESERESG